MRRPVRVVLIGLGKIARDQHCGALLRNPDFELVCAVDPQVASTQNLPVFPSIEALFSSKIEFDAAAVCTPPQIRKDICEKLFSNGCAVLLEKPPASDLATARSIGTAARKSGSVLFAAWHSRFSPHIDAARDWVRANKVLSGSIEWRENVEEWHPGQTWLWQAGGLGVFDPGINALSILTEIFPADWQVRNAKVSVPLNAVAPDAADFCLHADDITVSASFEFHQREDEIWRIQLVAANGETLELSEGGASLKLRDGAPNILNVNEYDGVYRRFSDLIRANQTDYDLAPMEIAENALLMGLSSNSSE
ncbi:MAG: galactose 1-dehydrogenase [Alphaproteobacteria bacterium HGW-Alphaproteobacteria-18]|nr:MAG: galactose 1-dehydrogenase [Alphaproteobacteria bacterium HGW-Alphaproteobacteria-18]